MDGLLGGHVGGEPTRRSNYGIQRQDLARHRWSSRHGALKVTERFRRRDFGHLDLEITIEYAKAYTRPWTVNVGATLFPDTELIEFVCNENEKDQPHLVGK